MSVPPPSLNPQVLLLDQEPNTHPSTRTSPSILYLNIHGLRPNNNRTKPDQLGDLARQNGAIIISTTESWLNEGVEDAEVSISGFNVFRADRASPNSNQPARAQGGVCVYSRADLTTTQICKFSNNAVEALVLEIRELQALVFTIYRPPDASKEEFKEAMDAVRRAIDEAQVANPMAATVIGLGDFNLPGANWTSTSSDTPRSTSSEKIQEGIVRNLMEELFMEQLVKTSTFSRSSNILDLVLSNNQQLTTHAEIITNFSFSDHHSIVVPLNTILNEQKTVNHEKDYYKTKIHKYDLKNATREEWNRFAATIGNINWEERTAEMSLEEKIQSFISMMDECVALIFKDKQSTRKGNKIPKEARKLMEKKSKLSKRILKTRCAIALKKMIGEVTEIEAKLAEMYSLKRNKEENAALKKIRTNPKYFYSYARKFQRSANSIGPFLDTDGNPVSNNEEMAEALSLQYKKVFSTPREDKVILHPQVFFGTNKEAQDTEDMRNSGPEDQISVSSPSSPRPSSRGSAPLPNGALPGEVELTPSSMSVSPPTVPLPSLNPQVLLIDQEPRSTGVQNPRC